MNHTLAATRGASLLDSRVPDWFRQINTSELNLASTTYCTLGQLFGTYYDGLTALNVEGDDRRYYYGFSTPDDNYEALTEAWLNEIASRLAEPATSTAGNHRHTVVEAVRMGREVTENRNTEVLIDLLVTVSGGDRALFEAVLNPLPQPLAPWERELLSDQPPF